MEINPYDFVNIDNTQFIKDINENIYVDKTLIIEKLNSLINTRKNKICVSRPRRFGKTTTTNLLTAYYSCGCDSRDLFTKTKLSKINNWDKYLNKFNVISLDIQEINGIANSNNKDLSKQIEELVNKELVEQFPDNKELDVSRALALNILSVYKATKKQFIMILDEYDVLVRAKKNDKVLDNYLELLNTLFKGRAMDNAFALVYLTGIFPIIKDTFQSKLNNFEESSILSPDIFSGLIGFSEDEVKELCDKYDMNFEECKAWYDGYKVGENNSIYNPKSVIKAIENHKFSDYWNITGSFESISDYLQFNIDGIYDDVCSMIRDNNKVVVNVSDFLNRIDNLKTKDDIFTYLIHIGYLAYDEGQKVCYIPNNEIRKEWVKALVNIHDLQHFYTLMKASEAIFDGILNLQSLVVSTNLDIIHHSTGDVNSYGNEAALHTSLIKSLTYARDFYDVFNEVSSGNGKADIVFIPKNNYSTYPTLIFELKVDESADKALKQIHDRNYPYNIDSEYKKNMILIGINYDRKTNKHECVMGRYKKENLHVV